MINQIQFLFEWLGCVCVYEWRMGAVLMLEGRGLFGILLLSNIILRVHIICYLVSILSRRVANMFCQRSDP